MADFSYIPCPADGCNLPPSGTCLTRDGKTWHADCYAKHVEAEMAEFREHVREHYIARWRYMKARSDLKALRVAVGQVAEGLETVAEQAPHAVRSLYLNPVATLRAALDGGQ